DIGVSKDILIPADEFPIYMPVWPEVGDELYCTLKLTNRDRLIALPARDSDMQEIVVEATPSMRNKNVNGRVYRSLQVGSFVLTDEHFRA
ncbi:hypothetical protein OFC15_29910, partial [Escherichia coli]|nr:hypothetical protein [Escherichia coli]